MMTENLSPAHRVLVQTVLRLLGREGDPEVWAAAARDLQNSGVSLSHSNWSEANALDQRYRERCDIDRQLRTLAQRRREAVAEIAERRAQLMVTLERELAVAVLGEET